MKELNAKAQRSKDSLYVQEFKSSGVCIVIGYDAGLFLLWGLVLLVCEVWARIDHELHPRR